MIIVENRSEDVYRDVFSRTDLTAKSKLLLLYLLLRGEGEFHFSPTRVAVRMGGSRQMVKSALRELERRGFLTRERINPMRRRYLYRVRFPVN